MQNNIQINVAIHNDLQLITLTGFNLRKLINKISTKITYRSTRYVAQIIERYNARITDKSISSMNPHCKYMKKQLPTGRLMLIGKHCLPCKITIQIQSFSCRYDWDHSSQNTATTHKHNNRLSRMWRSDCSTRQKQKNKHLQKKKTRKRLDFLYTYEA